MPPALRFSHFGIFAVDPHALATFYEDVLAFTRTDSGELPGPDGKLVKLVFLSRDPEEVRIALSLADLNNANGINFITKRLKRQSKLWPCEILRQFYFRLHEIVFRPKNFTTQPQSVLFDHALICIS